MAFVASAPCKAILFGEHYVVYGSPALSIAIEPRNTVEFTDGSGGMLLRTVFGAGKISPQGEFSGAPELAPYVAVAKEIFGSAPVPDCTAEFSSHWKLKGVGTSASFCAAFAAGLYRLAGKKAGAGMIFAAAQAGDLVSHGGRASGIDAKTVSFGRPLVFQRSFSPAAFKSKAADFSLPSSSALLLIDTYRGKKEGTAEMLRIFAREFGLVVPPADAPEEIRAQIRQEFAPLWKKISKSIGKASAAQLGALMSENHALLKKRKMSSAGMDAAVFAAISSGAYGAKLTGGGGEGGAVIALCEKKGIGGMARKISDETGFGCHALQLARKGACAD